jgi:hypothetical protein
MRDRRVVRRLMVGSFVLAALVAKAALVALADGPQAPGMSAAPTADTPAPAGVAHRSSKPGEGSSPSGRANS